jgi:yeast amino acid transporter
MSAGEAIDPRRTLAKAIKRVFWLVVPLFGTCLVLSPRACRRLATFYVIGIICVGILVASNDAALTEALKNGKGVASSAFVLALRRYRVNVLPDIINGVVITSAWSCAAAFCFTTVRILHGLALDGMAPR